MGIPSDTPASAPRGELRAEGQQSLRDVKQQTEPKKFSTLEKFLNLDIVYQKHEHRKAEARAATNNVSDRMTNSVAIKQMFKDFGHIAKAILVNNWPEARDRPAATFESVAAKKPAKQELLPPATSESAAGVKPAKQESLHLAKLKEHAEKGNFNAQQLLRMHSAGELSAPQAMIIKGRMEADLKDIKAATEEKIDQATIDGKIKDITNKFKLFVKDQSFKADTASKIENLFATSQSPELMAAKRAQDQSEDQARLDADQAKGFLKALAGHLDFQDFSRELSETDKAALEKVVAQAIRNKREGKLDLQEFKFSVSDAIKPESNRILNNVNESTSFTAGLLRLIEGRQLR